MYLYFHIIQYIAVNRMNIIKLVNRIRTDSDHSEINLNKWVWIYIYQDIYIFINELNRFVVKLIIHIMIEISIISHVLFM